MSRSTPRVLSSTMDLHELVQRTIAEGADAVCYKPFDMPKLIGAINRLTALDEPAA